jgi:RNA-directed DNA polymerase
MSLRMAKNPTGGVSPQHAMERHSLDSVSVQYVVKRDNILKAWKQVRANKGAAGIDGISIEEFPAYAQGTYFHTNTVDWNSLSGKDVIRSLLEISANRPLRNRMMGGVGRDG